METPATPGIVERKIHPSLEAEGVKSFFSGIILWSLQHDQLFFRVQQSWSPEELEMKCKFPGGIDNGSGEDQTQALEREVREEVIDRWWKDRAPLDLSNAQLIHTENRGEHRKFFYLAAEHEVFGYELNTIHRRDHFFRTYVMKDDDGDLLMPPTPIMVTELTKQNRLYRTHMPALVMAVRQLMHDSRVFRYLSPNFREMIESYKIRP